MEKVIPRGIPTISYIRILNQEQSGQSNDIEIDGDFVSIMESGQVNIFFLLFLLLITVNILMIIIANYET